MFLFESLSSIRKFKDKSDFQLCVRDGGGGEDGDGDISALLNGNVVFLMAKNFFGKKREQNIKEKNIVTIVGS